MGREGILLEEPFKILLDFTVNLELLGKKSLYFLIIYTYNMSFQYAININLQNQSIFYNYTLANSEYPHCKG